MHKRQRKSNALRDFFNNPLILPFYLPSFILTMGTAILAPTLPLYAEDFDVSYGLVGMLMAALSIGSLVAELPSGELLRRWGQKRAMLAGALIAIVTSIALFWAPSIYVAIGLRFITGFGMSLYGVARHVFISEQAAIAGRGKAMALSGGVMRLTRLLGPPLGGFIASWSNLRVPFLFSALFYVFAMFLIVSFVPKTRTTDVQGVVTKTKHGRGWVVDIIRSRGKLLAPAGVGQLFGQMIRAGRGTIIPLYASHVIGMDVDAIGLLLGIAAAVEMVMFIPGGWLMDNKGRKWAIVPSFALQGLGMALIPLTNSFGGLLACTALIGLANGLSSGCMMTLGADLAPPSARGEFLSIWHLIGDIGASGGPYAVGAVAEGLALPAAALTMAGAGVIASLVFGLLLPETLTKKPKPVTDAKQHCESVMVGE